jgi:hypothetical protein
MAGQTSCVCPYLTRLIGLNPKKGAISPIRFITFRLDRASVQLRTPATHSHPAALGYSAVEGERKEAVYF